MTAPVICPNCGAMQMRQWWDAGQNAYDCQSCHHLVGLDGTDRGTASRSLRSSGVLFIALIVVALAALLLAYPQLGN